VDGGDKPGHEVFRWISFASGTAVVCGPSLARPMLHRMLQGEAVIVRELAETLVIVRQLEAA
jgi:hypothetical protein